MTSNNDFIEFGETNLVPIENGWFLNKVTKDKIDPEGCVYNEAGELIFDPVVSMERDQLRWLDDKTD